MPEQTVVETATAAAACALQQLVDGSAGTMIPTGHYPEELAELALGAAAPLFLAEVERAEQRGYQARVQAERQSLRVGHSSYDDGYRDALEHNRGVHEAHRAEAARVLEAAAEQRGREQAAQAIEALPSDLSAEGEDWIVAHGAETDLEGAYRYGLVCAATAARRATPTPAGPTCTSCEDTGTCGVCRGGSAPTSALLECSACSGTHRCGQCSDPTPAGGEAEPRVWEWQADAPQDVRGVVSDGGTHFARFPGITGYVWRMIFDDGSIGEARLPWLDLLEHCGRLTEATELTAAPVPPAEEPAPAEKPCGALPAFRPGNQACLKPAGHEHGPDTDWKRDYHSNGLLKWRVDGADGSNIPPAPTSGDPS